MKIPPFDPTRPDCPSVREWAIGMYHADLAYHIDDDPHDQINLTSGSPTFTPEEADEVARIVNSFTDEQREEYFITVVSLVRAEAAYGSEEDDTIQPFANHVGRAQAHRLKIQNWAPEMYQLLKQVGGVDRYDDGDPILPNELLGEVKALLDTIGQP